MGSSSSMRSTRSSAARSGGGPDVSREGVQRDLLPIVEGSTVATKYGMVKTDHILFIAAGAFHQSQPSDLIPELQGRFPIRVELSALTEDDFVRILTEPRNALLKQYQALLVTEGVEVVFDADAVRRIAGIAGRVNESYGEHRRAAAPHGPDHAARGAAVRGAGDEGSRRVTMDGAMVEQRLAPILRDKDLSRFIL